MTPALYEVNHGYPLTDCVSFTYHGERARFTVQVFSHEGTVIHYQLLVDRGRSEAITREFLEPTDLCYQEGFDALDVMAAIFVGYGGAFLSTTEIRAVRGRVTNLLATRERLQQAALRYTQAFRQYFLVDGADPLDLSWPFSHPLRDITDTPLA